MHRAARLPTWRWIGLGVMAGIPVAALAGAFGDRQAEAFEEAGPLAVQVAWPSRAHVDTPRAVEVTVQNRSTEPLAPTTVTIDPAWAENFGQVDFEPEPEAAWSFALPSLPPGAEARVVGELRPLRAGRHTGHVEVRAGTAEVTLPLDTFVWP